MFLTALNKLCTEHKPARRFCRLKVIPPLKAEDVERRPDEGANFRNKIVRMMTDTGRCGELAAEFLFVLCKRSGLYFWNKNLIKIIFSWPSHQILWFWAFRRSFGQLWISWPSIGPKTCIGQRGLGDG